MSTEALDRVVALNRLAKKVENFWPSYRKEIAKVACDKYQASFVKADGHFVAFRCDVQLCAYTGLYGNSSCSIFGGFVSEQLEPYFLMALNKKREEIFDEMAKLIRYDAKKNARQAEEELNLFKEALYTAKKKDE